MDVRSHWDSIYAHNEANQVSWYSPRLSTSLELIRRANSSPTAAIIDVGGGESTLVDDLLAASYTDLTVLDISQAAIDASKRRLGSVAPRVHWLTADITGIDLEPAAYDIWHDRALFHFLIEEPRRAAYIRQVERALRPGGHVIVAAFGLEGPARCSGLDVVRYDARQLHGAFGPRFRLLDSVAELHHTPFGTVQQFLYCHCVVE